MSEFYKSLIRFLYVALGVTAVLAMWSMNRPAATARQSAPYDGRFGTEPQGITTTGTCVVRTKPELVEVTLGVRQSSKTARAARDYVKNTCAKIIDQLKKSGVEPKDIQTQNFSLVSRWDSGKNWEVIKWNAEEHLRVRIRKVDTVADLIDAASKCGANRIGSLEYTVSDLNELRARGRAKASEIASRKARELASKLGGKLGKLVKCSESYPGDGDSGYYNYYNGYYNNWALRRSPNYKNEQYQMSVSPQPDASGSEEITIQPGEMVTTVLVTASYELE